MMVASCAQKEHAVEEQKVAYCAATKERSPISMPKKMEYDCFMSAKRFFTFALKAVISASSSSEMCFLPAWFCTASSRAASSRWRCSESLRPCTAQNADSANAAPFPTMGRNSTAWSVLLSSV